MQYLSKENLIKKMIVFNFFYTYFYVSYNHRGTMKNLALFSFCLISIFAADPLEERFTNIYTEKTWGIENRSGGGSEVYNIIPYLDFLNGFLKKNNISSIIDLGCGTFMYFEEVNLEKISYTGVDIVKELIDLNNETYGNDHIKFQHGNIVEMEYPDADLVICKHVMQHLQNDDVCKILEKLKKFRYCLLVDQIKSPTPTNIDLPFGEDRPLDLLKPPFNLIASEIGHFYIEHEGNMHQFILVENHSEDES
jgi:SAM-dependent methyltransferase